MAQNITNTTIAAATFVVSSLSKERGGSSRTELVREYVAEALRRGVDVPLGEIEAELEPWEEVFIETLSSNGVRMGKFPILAVEIDGPRAIITSTRGRQIVCRRLPSGDGANGCRALRRRVVDLGYGPRYLVA